jgi:hypothetical protein
MCEGNGIECDELKRRNLISPPKPVDISYPLACLLQQAQQLIEDVDGFSMNNKQELCDAINKVLRV